MSQNTKRYDLKNDGCGGQEMSVRESGDWVMAEDFDRIASQRDELLAALKHLEVSANTVDYCYRKPSDKFSYALLCLRDDAEKAREAIAKAVQP